MKRRSYLASFFAVLSVLFLSGCAGNMQMVAPSQLVMAPESGKALVYLVRPRHVGTIIGISPDTIDAPIYANDRYIGSLTAGAHIAFQAEPGKYVFHSYHRTAPADHPDFVVATLAPGKTYHIRVGVSRVSPPSVSLEADNGQYGREEVKRSVNGTTQIVMTDRGRQWGDQNQGRALQFKNRYFRGFEKMVARDQRLANRLLLRTESGW